ncbi:MAG: DUF2851 family protein [Bacteroidia bacterium]|jgi:hypothetical protein|nr:DUF2851 family protein [Bacteroidia bacterium]
MTEDYLHYVWKTRQYNSSHLITSHGEPVQVLDPGKHNKDSGPDFSDARLIIGTQFWAGNVEIHLKASDWLRHGHQFDAAYKNIVLHVVYEDDSGKNGIRQLMPSASQTLALQGRLEEGLYARYQRFLNEQKWVPCASDLAAVPGIISVGLLGRMMAERMAVKMQHIKQELELTGMDWEQSFYRFLLRSFGTRVNAEPFSWLARTLPWCLLARKHDQLPVLEALLLGQAGLLPDIAPDKYCRTLSQTYQSLCKLHNLQPQPGHNWKHSRLRPANFPAVRLAQLAALIHKTPRLFHKMLSCQSPAEALSLLDVTPSAYWRNHFMPGVKAAVSDKKLGAQMQQLVLINVVIPFMFARGVMHDDDLLREKALNWLDELAPEQNTLIRNYQQHGLKATNASESQALIHLHKNYCMHKNCLNCTIGRYLLEAPASVRVAVRKAG